MDFRNFQIQERDAQVIVVLDRPPVNALNSDTLRELRQLIERVHSRDDVRVAILTNAGKVFCAGADMKERQGMSDEEVKKFVATIQDTLYSWYKLEIPTICAMQGGAFGGGLELALMCDFRILSDEAEVGFKETRLGIIPGAGGTQRLARIAGESTALKWILTGKTFTASQALADGIVNQVVEPDRVLEEAESLSREIVQAAPIAVRQAKRAIKAGLEKEYRDGLALEQQCYKITIPTRDRQEALAAFLEKRKPNWSGE